MSQAFCEGVRPPSLLSPSDWASKHVSLANSERSSKFDISQAPWWRGPMDWAADGETTNIVVIAPTGAGKSAMAEGLIPWIVSEAPGPLLYASQTDSDAKFWAETRLMPALRSCDQILKLWPKDRHKSRTCEILFPHMPLLACGANMSNFQEKSCQWLIGDEVWRWTPGLVREFLARHHDRWNRKVLMVSQGGYKDDDLNAEFDKTDKSEWSFSCPSCEAVLRWGRDLLKFDTIQLDTGGIDIQSSADTAQLQCPECDKVFNDNPKTRRMLSNRSFGVPTAEGLTGYRGLRIHRLAIWWIPWASYVIKFLSARQQLKVGNVDPYRQLIQKDDCQFWSDEMSVSRKEYKLSPIHKSARNPLEKIPNEKVRFLTCDRGGDHFWGVVRAWDHDGNSELLWEGYVAQKGQDDGQYIEEIRERYGVESNATLVDIGYEWAKTAEMCATFGWVGIRGNGQVKSYIHKQRQGGTVEKLFSQVRIANGDRGGRCRYVEIATDPVKDVLWRLMNGNEVEWKILPDASKAYLRHLKAEVRKVGTKGKGKQEVGFWEQVDRQNHLWDCEVYQVAAAMIANALG